MPLCALGAVLQETCVAQASPVTADEEAVAQALRLMYAGKTFV
jgi:hypothetical protein